jgi:hypothetical protein
MAHTGFDGRHTTASSHCSCHLRDSSCVRTQLGCCHICSCAESRAWIGNAPRTLQLTPPGQERALQGLHTLLATAARTDRQRLQPEVPNLYVAGALNDWNFERFLLSEADATGHAGTANPALGGAAESGGAQPAAGRLNNQVLWGPRLKSQSWRGAHMRTRAGHVPRRQACLKHACGRTRARS